jgi:ABC-type multidrug transport system ATPase subunit
MDEAEYATRIAFLDHGHIVSIGTREEILASYPRPLVDIRTSDRLKVRAALESLPEVDDISLFGTRLHARGSRPITSGAPTPALSEAEGSSPALFANRIREALEDLVAPADIQPIKPSLEDVFVLVGSAEEDAS